MKEMIDKLRARRNKWLIDDYPDKLMIAMLTDCMFAVMERPVEYAWPFNVEQLAVIERSIMIKTLQWVCQSCDDKHCMPCKRKTECSVGKAIISLESGGNLPPVSGQRFMGG